MSRKTSDALAVLAAFVVFGAVGHSAGALLAYPWDWSPDEGLALDYARRLVEAPRTLYGRELIPFPAAYTPLLPLLLAPLVGLSEVPLLPARLLALAWTAAAATGLFLLVRRRSGPALALVAAAIVLAPQDFSVWFLLVRVDGLMVALWLGAAAALIPARVERGADTLSSARLWAGSVLLLASVLTKPTAVVHGAPLVLGWFLVDRRSAWRLTGTVLAGGIASLAALQIATDGGFLWTMRLWATHPRQAGLFEWIVTEFVAMHGMLLALVVVAIVWASKRREEPFRDGAWLLVLGGLAIVPALGKGGAAINYLIPLYCALVALACRLWPPAPHLAVLLPAALGLALLARPFPLPTSADSATSAAFYSFVRDRGRPILATRPDYAYFVVRQPVEVEGNEPALPRRRPRAGDGAAAGAGATPPVPVDRRPSFLLAERPRLPGRAPGLRARGQVHARVLLRAGGILAFPARGRDRAAHFTARVALPAVRSRRRLSPRPSSSGAG